MSITAPVGKKISPTEFDFLNKRTFIKDKSMYKYLPEQHIPDNFFKKLSFEKDLILNFPKRSRGKEFLLRS